MDDHTFLPNPPSRPNRPDDRLAEQPTSAPSPGSEMGSVPPRQRTGAVAFLAGVAIGAIPLVLVMVGDVGSGVGGALSTGYYAVDQMLAALLPIGLVLYLIELLVSLVLIAAKDRVGARSVGQGMLVASL